MKRWVVLSLLCLLMLIILLPAVLVIALASETGFQRLAAYTETLVPQLSLQGARGRLLGRAQLSAVAWRDDAITVELRELAITVSPLCFISLDVCAEKLSVGDITIDLHSPKTAEREPVVLPEIALGFELLVGNAHIKKLKLSEYGETLFSASDIRADRFGWRQSRVSFMALRANLLGETLQAKGAITLSGDYPIQSTLNVAPQQWPDLRTYIQPAQGVHKSELLEATVTGTLRQLQAAFTLQGLTPLQGQLELQTLAEFLPFTATVNLTRPLSVNLNESSLGIERTTLNLAGNIKLLTFSATSELAIPWAIGRAKLQLAASTDFASLQIQQATLVSQLGQLSSTGEFYFDDSVASQLQLSARALNPAVLYPPVVGSIDADASVTVSQWLSTPIITAELSHFAGSLAGAALSTKGAIALQANQQWQFKQWQLLSNGAAISIDGAFPNAAATWSASVNDIERYVPDMGGKIAANGRLTGSLARPSLQADVKATELVYGNLQAASIDARLAMNQLGWQTSQLDVRAKAITLPGLAATTDATLMISAKQPSAAKLMNSDSLWPMAERLDTTINLAVQHIDQWQASTTCHQTVSWLELELTGQCERALIAVNEAFVSPPSSVKNKAAEVQWLDWKNDRPIQFHWQTASQHLALAPFCLQHAPSSLCLQNNVQWVNGQSAPSVNRAAPTAIELKGKQLPMAWLMAFTPDNYAVAGTWGFNTTLTERSGAAEGGQAWRLKGNVAASKTLLTIKREEESPLSIPIEKIKLKFTAENQAFHSTVDLASEQFGKVAGELNYQQQTLQGKLLLNAFDLEPLGALLPDVKKWKGVVSSDLSFSWRDELLDLSGDLTLSQLALTSRLVPVDIDKGDMQWSFLGKQARLTGQFGIGEGLTSFSGDAQWSPGDWLANLSIHSSSIRIEPLPHSYLYAQSDLLITASPGKLAIGGEITIPKARIEIEKLPSNAVAVSNDTIIEEQAEDTSSTKITARIKTVLGDDVKFRGFGLETYLTGGLVIEQKPEQLTTGNGVVNLKAGRFRAYGQDLLIEEGRMIFAGSLLNPELYVTAVRTHAENNVRVGVLATGSANDPKVSLFSNPPMAEQNKLYYLLTGKAPGGNGSNNQAQIAQQTAIALSLAQSNQRAGEIANSLGIQDFQMTTDRGKTGEEAQFSGYLTPDLYILYGVSLFDQLSSITARYSITPDVYVEIYDSSSSAIDVFWSIIKE